MKIDHKLVEHVAKLAHLNLKPDELEYYGTQLSKILSHIEQLQELKSVPAPNAGGVQSSTLERPDLVVAANVLDAALAQAPEHIGSAFQVPRIIEQ